MKSNYIISAAAFYVYVLMDMIKYIIAVRVAQWLERRRSDLVILASPVRIPLWDVGAVPSDETA
jgi:hypothetical protein